MDSYDVANSLLKNLVDRYDAGGGMGTWSCSIYDTAWVSLVSRTVDGSTRWVFPESFKFIYDSQDEDGRWRAAGSSDIDDAIINTLICLISLKRHERAGADQADLPDRAEKAVRFLRGALESWDVASTERIAFEVIVPRLLELLEEEGIQFEFPQRGVIYEIYAHKLKRLDFESLYEHSAARTGVLHSLEAFVGKCDFDRLAHHKRDGNFMASPASTAAYLMCTSVWDDDAEQYLRHVIDQCKSYGYGAVSCAWPTTIMEFAWSVCNIMESGFEREKLDQPSLQRIGSILHAYLSAENGTVGFAPNITPDADDTSKALATVQYIGMPVSLGSMLEAFELPTHFQCYQRERNPSVTVNCNVLMALLHFPDPEQYSTQILKAATFITNEYWSIEGLVQDKWHVSPWYPALVTTRTMLRLIYLHGQGIFADATDFLIKEKIPAILFRILSCILQLQREDGSWGANGNQEETGYCILSLAQLASLPYTALLRGRIDDSVAAGRRYLQTSAAREMNASSLIWIEKVLYSIERICQSYVICALYCPVPAYSPETVSSGAPATPYENLYSFPRG